MNLNFSLPLHLKSADVAPSGEFSGYAAVFGNVDFFGHIIVPGAFTNTLVEHKKRGTLPALLWDHNLSMPIGVFTEMREDTRGLFASARLALTSRTGSEAYALLRDGAVGGMSIGFTVPDGGLERSGDSLLLKQINLIETSLVAVPANPEARVINVKSLEDRRALEAALREGTLPPLSRRQAVIGAAKLWPALTEREAQDGDREDRLAVDTRLKSIGDELMTLTQLLERNM